MSRPVYLYRVVVDHWPTPDCNPWPRFITVESDGEWGNADYEDPSDEPQAWVPFTSDGGWPDALSSRIRDRAASQYHDEPGGMVLPKTTRRHYLSKAAAEAWCRDARLLGAECHIETGRVEWLP